MYKYLALGSNEEFCENEVSTGRLLTGVLMLAPIANPVFVEGAATPENVEFPGWDKELLTKALGVFS